MNDAAPELCDPVRLAAVARSGLFTRAPDPAADELVRSATSLLEVPMAALAVVDDRVTRLTGYAGPPLPGGRELPVGLSLCRRVVEDGVPLVLTDVAAEVDAGDNPWVSGGGIAAWAGLPVCDPSGRVVGVFCIADTRPREWTARELELLSLLARAVTQEAAARATDLDLARMRDTEQDLRERSRRLAATLRDVLLPGGEWSPSGLSLASVAGSGPATEACGSFTDVFALDRETWAVSIGRVEADGPDVAALAAFTRLQMRSAAHVHGSPGEVLRRVDHVLFDRTEGLGPDVSALFLRATPLPGGGVRVQYANAGHPAPAIRDAEGAVHWPPADGSPLCNEVAPPRPVEEVVLPPGSAMLLAGRGALRTAAIGARDERGAERIAETFATTVAWQAPEIAEAVEHAVLQHTVDGPGHDLAIVVVEPAVPMTDTGSLVLPPRDA